MKKRIPYQLIIPVVIFIMAIVYLALRDRTTGGDLPVVSPAFRSYIQAFTSGVVSTRTSIKVRLTEDFADTSEVGRRIGEELFSFSPALSGSVTWIDRRTVAFQPDEPMPQDRQYTVSFFLSKLVTVPDSLKTMVFGFRTLRQEIEVWEDNHTAVNPGDLSREFLAGRLLTSDVADDQSVELMFTAEQSGKNLPVTWTHGKNGREHLFRVDSVRRGSRPGEIVLSWKGEIISSENTGKLTVEIPALGDFRVLSIRSMRDDQPCLAVRFSDPPDPRQDLDGLFRVGSFSNLRHTLEDNILKIYLPETGGEKVTLTLEPEVRSVTGKTLGKRVTETVKPEDLRPGVRFIGDGVIMPSSNGMLLPFEAVNLSMVDIRVIRVYEQNILQFLQVNDLPGNSELVRVGRIVLKKSVPLNGAADRGKWNRYSIDLSTLMKAEPGALYSVILSFNQGYSLFPCGSAGDSTATAGDMVRLGDPAAENEQEWGWYSNYYDDDFRDGGWRRYRWEERDDPCKPSYYFGKSVSRNVLASDLGIIAKAGSDGRWHCYVTDILTTRPVAGAVLELYNFQLQKISSAKSNADGMAEIHTGRTPFVLVAKSGKQTGYLKLQEGKSLSLSMFDVSGEAVQKGVKGFIYGERGVWRPGDSIFLTFILDDRSAKVPAGHPVTLSLINPAGQTIQRLVRTKAVNGFYTFGLSTSPDAPTGNWVARVTIGNSEFTKILKIETVKPNRLKILFDLPAAGLVRDRIPSTTLKAGWLTGISAGGLKATVRLTLSRSVTAFRDFQGYIFDNPTVGFAPENITVFDGTLDAGGSATITPKIHVTNVAPGALKASFETTVFEGGGDFSTDRFSVPYFPYATYAGLSVPLPGNGDRVLYTAKTWPVELVNVDAGGKPVASGSLKVELFRLEWRWWWDDTGGGSADFISTSYNRPVESVILNTSGGRAIYNLFVASDDWGRYLVKVTDLASGHAAGKVVYVDWPGYYRLPGGEKQAAAMLTLTSDKQSYKAGEKVRLTLPTSPDGRALVTLENGTSVLRSFWVPTTQGSTVITFEATPEMAPNCYAFVTLIQPHAQTKNDLPVRLYGVTGINVENPGSHLRPVIRVADELQPGKEVTIGVKEAEGRPMTYTLAVVDEGLLDLTRFKTPDPWELFYAREALGVKTWDMYDMVMGAFSGELQRILSIGGDRDEVDRSGLKANRFKPMVKFLGPFTLAKGKIANHTFTMPEYIGSVRVMVVAGQDGAYGCESKAVPVRKPLMVLATLPRVLGPGETVSLPVSVFAMDSKVKNVRVEVTAEDPARVEGTPARSLVFSSPGEKMAGFRLRIAEKTGIARIRVTAVAGNLRAEHRIEIEVRNPGLPVSNVISAEIRPGGEHTFAVKAPGMEGTNEGLLELSVVPSLNISQRLDELIRYPYGCLEQTISSVFPQLLLPAFADLSDSRKAEIQRNITAAIEKLNGLRLTNGGFGSWPRSRYADDWATSYAGHFLLEAEKQGYALPVGWLPKWKEFQRQKAVSWNVNAGYYNDELAQAYRLYTLALAGAPETGAMNRLLENTQLSSNARWRLAAAFQAAGKREIALRLVSSASVTIKPYTEMDGTYGSDLRDRAMILETLTLMDQRSKAMPIAQEIAFSLNSANWYSTQTTAYALLALVKFSGGSAGEGVKASMSRDGAAAEMVEEKKPMAARSVRVFSGQPGSLKIVNKGKGVLYARLITSGIPFMGDSAAASSNLKLSVLYKSLDGKIISPLLLKQGTVFLAEVTVGNPGLYGNYRQMALSQVIPSGWEIVNARMSDLAASAGDQEAYTYQDVRDDRAYTFFDLAAGRSKTITLMLQATYSGRFYLPSLLCGAMYDKTVSARIPGRWVEVRPEKE